MRSCPASLFRLPALATVLLATSLHAAPFTNGSLESGSGAFIETVAAGVTANGWTVSGANVEFVRQGYTGGGDTVAAAHDGFWMVDLNGTGGAGTISQTFDTLPGQQYLIEFWMSGNAGPLGATSADTKSLLVSWNSGTVANASYVHQVGDGWSNLRWEDHAVVVTAVGTSSTLAFTSTSTFYADAGPLVDDIRITPIPEPSAVAAALGGLALLAATLRRVRHA